jgi:hypothetical protein
MRGEGWMIGSRSEFRVLNTTPPQPASNARLTISALLETGEDESRNGLLKCTPQKFMDKSTLFATIIPPLQKVQRLWVQRFKAPFGIAFHLLTFINRWYSNPHGRTADRRTAEYSTAEFPSVVSLGSASL